MNWLVAPALLLTAAVATPAQTWRQVGPPGGTVISLGADPHDTNRLYLGTSDGHVFTTSDEGAHWHLLSRIGVGQDDVITHIVVDSRDSRRIFASTWSLYTGGGGVYRSNDSGRTWQIVGLAHETVRALAQSPTHPKTWLAGSLTGIYRSSDEGANWERITPAKHDDLKNFDSVAFDPRDDNVIYAGTYHLPWKSTDGGKNWSPISKGMIDDSDVMSIIVDPANPDSVHATACSGIYHSTNAAQQWTKYKGIPFVFRRTQLIRQDPQHPETLYAGTTSGLWKTTSEAGQWKRITPVDWVVNDIVIDAKNPQRVIIGTEREGVQISQDGGATFAAANTGFHHQHILDVAMDRDRPERELVVLTFDTNAFLATKDGGNTWTSLGAGLKRTDLKHVYASPNGWWASLNKGGFMKYEETNAKWVRAGLFATDSASPASLKTKRGAAAKRPGSSKAPQLLSSQVNDLTFTNSAWYAATSSGVLVSHDRGIEWKLAGREQFVKQATQSLDASADGSHVWAIAQRNLIYSADGGAHWDAKELAFASAGNLRVHRVDDSNLLITSNSGLYVSKDAGREWNRADIRDLQFQDAAGYGNALVVSLQRHGLLASFDGGKSWQRVTSPLAEGYFPVVRARRDGAVIAASATEGLLAYEPEARSADSSLSGSASTGAQKPKN
ncbi:MAG TPA: YCF48-related protein [Candidatus Acidoferrum sp.]|nr:YCF48-related protein [Candidatus Acidoferrum sp.]